MGFIDLEHLHDGRLNVLRSPRMPQVACVLYKLVSLAHLNRIVQIQSARGMKLSGMEDFPMGRLHSPSQDMNATLNFAPWLVSTNSSDIQFQMQGRVLFPEIFCVRDDGFKKYKWFLALGIRLSCNQTARALHQLVHSTSYEVHCNSFFVSLQRYLSNSNVTCATTATTMLS